jgi:hypothetical protein
VPHPVGPGEALCNVEKDVLRQLRERKPDIGSMERKACSPCQGPWTAVWRTPAGKSVDPYLDIVQKPSRLYAWMLRDLHFHERAHRRSGFAAKQS